MWNPLINLVKKTYDTQGDRTAVELASMTFLLVLLLLINLIDETDGGGPKIRWAKKTRTTSFFVCFVYFFSLLVMYATSVICLLTIFIDVVLLYTTHMNATGCGIDLKTDTPKLLTKTLKNICIFRLSFKLQKFGLGLWAHTEKEDRGVNWLLP